ncbi:MAG: DNA polymerase III subunit delta' [Marivibrio sp.]|uniref:DNA polymerase III subunit delta' n=1 Tax=Marivibrio sp. TaxID=2039719 RepID=UPI0032ED2DD3
MARAAKKSDESEELDPFDPRRNPHLEGHEAAERTVLEAWNSGRFPHAWLICGPRGIGKATFAFRLARFVMESGGAGRGGAGLFGAEPLAADGLAISPESRTYHLVSSGGHPDLRVLTRGMPNEDNKPTPTIINVYQTRRVVDFTYQTSAISDWRVVIVDPADDFNTASANAILKALEEPPSKALFLLLSHSPGGLLPTIRSRCRKLQMAALPDETVAMLIRRYRPEVGAEEAGGLARLAEGSVGRALDYHAAGGLALFREMAGVLARPKDPDMERVSALADRTAMKGKEAAYGALVDLSDWWFKRLIRGLALGAPPSPLDELDAAALAAFQKLGDLEAVMAMRDEALHRLGQADPPANLDRRQLIFALFGDIQRRARAL